ncbi:MAG: HAD-IIIC family phosphatase [Halioglobus sp.]|nr:HAD-IIIC family phosphatase [Halioglobus sp.]
MKVSDTKLAKLLKSSTRQEVKDALLRENLLLSPGQLKQVHGHLVSLAQNVRPIKLGIVHTYTSELIDPWLEFAAALDNFELDIYHAPYGVTLQEAHQDSGLARHKPDLTLVMLQQSDLHPTLQQPISNLDSQGREALEEAITHYITRLAGGLREVLGGHIVLSILPRIQPAGLGQYDDYAPNSELHWWCGLKARLAIGLGERFSGISYLDLDRVAGEVGRRRFFDLRLWYASSYPFTPEGAFAVAGAINTVIASVHLARAKVIILDADNTLWGGVIGEDGMTGIALGPEYPGRAYRDFQSRILALQQRGFILALCSKNNANDLIEVLNDHPHQLLKRDHFAAERVNWQPKSENIRSIAAELNLGLDSFIFVDDSDHECAAVRHALPEVDVVQVPNKPMLVPTCLDHIARLEVAHVTNEDLAKTAMYAQERQRKTKMKEITGDGGSLTDYLQSLNMTMQVSLDRQDQVTRLSQLTLKTNQFNLTTRRYSEEDIASKIDDMDYSVFSFSLADNFGDSGIVGLAIVENPANRVAKLDTFLMSCRVIGRQAEQGFLRRIIHWLRVNGYQELSAEYIPTKKNMLVAHFLETNGFEKTENGTFLTQLNDPVHEIAEDLPIKIHGLTKV